ncbi:hypothetical protein TVAG_020090 [Trichomonas vaginalis G3]|uniref:DUF4200 domain-containing protein n=1 Tax=Trichomonas vaginalis (strain ATCC PRA-98 / G3) TaxID=412133 RepID=A2EPZ8_TRIV3|nr:cilia- and flagella-associated protein 100 family [Trichomonas vaginalis G3]EAY05263.1 hypothetical protein TVAG_020090 [Trichomonas vaginalis G3]KAI5530458.1 cilia- and flagella-associated protein 100 family [Trichomonas vaginalis G3]|eukprot:XP_001317486.1 hypothetical protein [Trichomonas vaginalis G3]
MDDLEQILRLTDISCDGEAVEYNKNGNPFITVSRNTKAETRESRNNRLSREQLELSQRSLEERAEQTRVRVPVLITPATSAHQSRANSRATSAASKSLNSVTMNQVKARTKTMPEKMYQMRQVYLTQLLINKKQHDIAKLHRIQVNTEAQVIKDEQDCADEANEYKISMNKLQAALSKSRKQAAENSAMYSTLNKELIQLQASVNTKTSIISKNEEILETYQECEKFLKGFLNEGYNNIFEYFNHPSVLVDELDLLQSETLNLVKCYNHYVEAQGVINEKVQKKASQQEQEEKDITASENKPRELESRDYNGTEAAKKNDSLDQEIAKLKQLVTDTYVACFGSKPDISPMNMLEKIESSLESMIKIEDTVSSDILSEIKTKKDEERKLKERLDGQEKRRLEQLRKVEQALQRANKSIPKHDKKRSIERMLPYKLVTKHRNQSDILAAQQEKENALLFGPPE